MLTMPEELMLLALNDEKGAVEPCCAIALPFGLAGAVVMELSRMGRVRLEENTPRVADERSTGDAILDEALAALAKESLEQNLDYWIARPDRLAKGMQDRLIDQLVEKGILKREEHRFLWLIPYARYPERDGRAEEDIRRHLREVVLEGAAPDKHTALLLCLVHACKLASEVFPGEDYNQVSEKLKEFAEGDRVTKVVADNVMAVTMAVVTSSISASAMAFSDAHTTGL